MRILIEQGRDHRLELRAARDAKELFHMSSKKPVKLYAAAVASMLALQAAELP